MEQSRDQLMQRKSELEKRLQAIRNDLGLGLAADSAEQAIELENLEVLQEINRLAEVELNQINAALAKLNE
ncbi:MAG: hypothetical protein SH820_01310 [Xanthomonadales bacterium]|nr:hypothetical protein [Xanthomonadales bacterium]